MMKWEYDIEFIDELNYLGTGTGSEPLAAKQKLKWRGIDGWEFVAYNEGWCIFKRPIELCACSCKNLDEAEEEGCG